MITKDNSVETELHPTLTSLLFYLDSLYRNWGSELIITSGSEDSARHSFTSLHYAKPCQAVDVRIWQLAEVPKAAVQHRALILAKNNFCEIHSIPTNWFDIILESNHIHIEYQPKRKEIN